MNVDFEPHEDLEIIGIPCLTCATKHLYDRTVEPDSGLGCSRVSLNTVCVSGVGSGMPSSAL